MSEERIITAATVTTGEKNDRQDYCFLKGRRIFSALVLRSSGFCGILILYKINKG